MEKISMDELKRINREGGYYWFEPSTMRFFKTKVGKIAYRVGNNAYFISSEQDDFSDPRFYTIRICNLIEGNIDTIGNFQEFETRQQAKTRLMLIIGEK